MATASKSLKKKSPIGNDVKKIDKPVKLNMTFEEAMKKALNTPLTKKKKAK